MKFLVKQHILVQVISWVSCGKAQVQDYLAIIILMLIFLKGMSCVFLHC